MQPGISEGRNPGRRWAYLLEVAGRLKERNTFLSENVTRLEDEAQKALDEAMSAKQQSSLDARDIIQKAENEAREIRASAEQYASMIEGKMQEVYGDLKQYKDGVNLVEGKYLDSFEITGNRIIINMRNRTNHSVRPDLHISFFDRNGFVIASISESWLLDSIDSGGRRVEDNTIYFRHGAIPYYYTASE